MKSNRVMLRVEEFRALGKAEIKLDGITVVAGVNGCGKSTLSKLLYWGVNISTDFEMTLNKTIESYQDLYIDLERELIRSILFPFRNAHEIISWLRNFDYLQRKNKEDKNFYELKTEKLFTLKEQIYLKQQLLFSEQNENQLRRFNRFWDVCYSRLENLVDDEVINELKLIKNDNNWESMIDFLVFYVQWIYNKSQTDLEIQPTYYFNEKIIDMFHVHELPKKLEIWEKDVPIISIFNENIMSPFEIDNVIYIDTPMFFGHTEEEHWKDANEKLKQHPKLNENPKPIQEIDDLIKRQIFRNGAEVKFDELSKSFTFRTSSGVEMDLSDSATGMKTFAVLDRLVKNGSINKKTLLILDEPEAHLHPQWIVELGRLLTLINKHIGAKIFVATHSPNMVQALRYIPNKEGTRENVNFYLAQYNEENGLFDYKDLNGKVGEIFTSFNKSLSKLEQYGE